MPTETLSPEEMAASAFRAFCFAGQVEVPPSWEEESCENQDRWLRLAQKAQQGLLDFDGQPVKQAAAWLLGHWSHEEPGKVWGLLPRGLQLCWEAVARHLNTLLDSDEVSDVGALERSWNEWAKERAK